MQQFQQHHVALPQQQQQQQQQPQQHQQQAGGLQQQNGQPASAGGAGAPPMSLAGVLHYLQSEWRRWERDRNEWEIERAEMRARIALLEGERRSAENLKSDMLRRVKMLEFALRQERSKTLSSASQLSGGTLGASSVAPSKLTSILAEDRQSASGSSAGPGEKDSGKSGDVQGRSRGSSSPRSVGSSLPNDPTQSAGHMNGTAGPAGKRGTNASSASSSGDNAWSRSIAAPIRDPKSRAKSREYLKQCLQEISYLTSPAALNPLPTRVPITLAVPEIPGSESEKHEPELPSRPKKELSSEPVASAWGSRQPAGTAEEVREPEEPIPNAVAQEISDAAKNPNPDSAPAADPRPNADAQDQLLTAIYKPESKEAWKEALRAANEKAEQAKRNTEASAGAVPDAQAEAEARRAFDAAPSEHIRGNSLTALPVKTEEGVRSHRWSTRAQLKSHLDAVRAIAFGPDSTIISASIDCTVKVWRPDAAGATGKPPTFPTDAEPVATLRGHTAGVTSLAVSRSKHRIFSGSIDASIRVWNMPSSEHQTYSPHDATLGSDLLVGHGDAIWDLALVPSATDPEGYLVSASADGTVKIWQAESREAKGKPGYSLMTSFGYSSEGEADKDIVPVSVGPYHPDLSKVLVGFSNSVVKVFEIKSGSETASFGQTDAANTTPGMTQSLSHPELPIILTAHDDGTVRILDAQTGETLTSFRAHADTVNCLDIDPVSQTEFVTAGDDCSCKIWTLPNIATLTPTVGKASEQPSSIPEPTCVQEWTLHRRKSDQGVLVFKYMGSEGATSQGGGIEGLIGAAAGQSKGAVLASGGADGIVRVYATSTAGH